MLAANNHAQKLAGRIPKSLTSREQKNKIRDMSSTQKMKKIN
jgi:hypothetical protein